MTELLVRSRLASRENGDDFFSVVGFAARILQTKLGATHAHLDGGPDLDGRAALQPQFPCRHSPLRDPVSDVLWFSCGP